MFTGNYREDLAVAKKLGIIKGNPKKEVLYNVIRDYEVNNIPEFQKISEMALVDELIALCDTSDRPSLLPKPVLKRDRVKPQAPILKRDRVMIEPDPLKRPTPKPVKRGDRKAVVMPKLKLNKPNRSLFQ